jgi:hypothetical protein
MNRNICERNRHINRSRLLDNYSCNCILHSKVSELHHNLVLMNLTGGNASLWVQPPNLKRRQGNETRQRPYWS